MTAGSGFSPELLLVIEEADRRAAEKKANPPGVIMCFSYHIHPERVLLSSSEMRTMYQNAFDEMLGAFHALPDVQHHAWWALLEVEGPPAHGLWRDNPAWKSLVENLSPGARRILTQEWKHDGG
jgi:hypothetical protein